MDDCLSLTFYSKRQRDGPRQRVEKERRGATEGTGGAKEERGGRRAPSAPGERERGGR